MGQRLPLGDPHDGQGQRPQLATFPQHQSNDHLLICDELHNVYHASLNQSRVTERHWLKRTHPDNAPPTPLGIEDAVYQRLAVQNPMTVALYDHPDGQARLVQSYRGAVSLYKQLPGTDQSDIFEPQNQAVLHAQGVPAALPWHRDERRSLILAQPDGRLLLWHGLDHAEYAPLAPQGLPLLAAGVPISFTGQPHINIVDWNNRSRCDLLVATAQGELWLFYDIGSEDQVAYDAGRKLSDANGPIQLLGPCSATILQYDNRRWLVVADSQGQLWRWQLLPAQSWHVTDWASVAHVPGLRDTIASQPQPGQWWQGPLAGRANVLRIGPQAIDRPLSQHHPLSLPPLPDELVIPVPFRGPCEVYITLASLEDIFTTGNDTPQPPAVDPAPAQPFSLSSMIDVRLGGAIHPHMLCAGPIPKGQTREIYWGTATLTDATLHLRGLHGGTMARGGLPVAVASLRIVPLTPQPSARLNAAAARIQSILGHPAPATSHANTSVLQDNTSASQDSATAATTAASDDPHDDMLGEELLSEELLSDELLSDDLSHASSQAAVDPSSRVMLAGLFDPAVWTSLIRADSATEIDELVARHQSAGIERLYWRVGPAPWTYPSQVPGARTVAPSNATPAQENACHLLDDHFRYINRLQIAAAAATARHMSLYAWLELYHHQPQSPWSVGCVDQFLLNHPHYAELDQHGRRSTGRLCLGHQPVRDYFINIVREMMNMGIQGLMIDIASHLPCVGYGQPILDSFQRQHQGMDMRTLSPFDLRATQHQADTMTRFMRELRSAVHHARPRQRMPIHAIISRPYTMLGCDPGTWAREHLVDGLILTQPMAPHLSLEHEAHHTSQLATMKHLLQDTSCELGAMLSLDSSQNLSFATHQMLNSIRRRVNDGASFILLQHTSQLISRRGLCQQLAQLNYPLTLHPRAVLG